MKRFIIIPAICLLCTLTLAVSPARADSIVGSPHDLSAQNPAIAVRIRASTETRVCIFCHTPHHANKLTFTQEYSGPLWSRMENTAVNYIPYESTTIAATPGQPQGSSRVCLSCHDGTIALGAPTALGISSSETFGGNTMLSYGPPGSGKKTAVLGKNLSDDHPISMEYGLKPEEFVDPGPVLARLLSWRSPKYYVECTSCHSPHDNQYGNFLVTDSRTQKDAICTMCHNKSGWSVSKHKTADSIKASGCINCHTPHGAQQGVDLLAFTSEALPSGISRVDTNCVTSTCHTATTPQFSPAGRYVHPLAFDGSNNQHSETELLPITLAGNGNLSLSGSKHVHCIDCHNPHKANQDNSPLNVSNAPVVNGVLYGVRGVTVNGVAIDMNTAPYQGFASNEFQVCFRCHAGSDAAAGYFSGSVASGGPYVQRVYASLDESLRFKSTAISSHPVDGLSSGNRSNLVAGYGSASFIYCSSCHNPHGSTQPHMLQAANRDTFDTTSYNPASYALCFGCHDEAWLMTSAPSSNLHKAHVQGLHDPASANPFKGYKAPCSVCHDPHGVPAGTGSTVNNASHLVNFQQRYVPSTGAYSNSAKTCFSSGAGGDGTTTCHTGAAALYQTNYNSAYPYAP